MAGNKKCRKVTAQIPFLIQKKDRAAAADAIELGATTITGTTVEETRFRPEDLSLRARADPYQGLQSPEVIEVSLKGGGNKLQRSVCVLGSCANTCVFCSYIVPYDASRFQGRPNVHIQLCVRQAGGGINEFLIFLFSPSALTI